MLHYLDRFGDLCSYSPGNYPHAHLAEVLNWFAPLSRWKVWFEEQAYRFQKWPDITSYTIYFFHRNWHYDSNVASLVAVNTVDHFACLPNSIAIHFGNYEVDDQIPRIWEVPFNTKGSEHKDMLHSRTCLTNKLFQLNSMRPLTEEELLIQQIARIDVNEAWCIDEALEAHIQEQINWHAIVEDMVQNFNLSSPSAIPGSSSGPGSISPPGPGSTSRRTSRRKKLSAKESDPHGKRPKTSED
ncbi:hypothetical protein MLD38_018773 [Melastoma candidum]|uniref:Uncharacterized protein n=1 Tax=Melastoma candidum TaxID=119954 RepID=A0ACB9QUW6_9MYRT|nr:hypothetical protein MLD38_018773 [Melastoma candidum]